MAGMIEDHGHGMGDHPQIQMHMTFFWGKDVYILFSKWPGHSLGMYVLALFVVFALAVAVEWLSGSRLIGQGANRVAAGFCQTVLHAVRMGLAYLVMLAVMSFNVGVLIAAVLGHAVGFLLFGSSLFKRSDPEQPPHRNTTSHSSTTLPPMKC